MPQVFHPSTNTLARISIIAFVMLLLTGGWLGMAVVRSSYITQAETVREQPVPFSHRHHVHDAGLDCRYCHREVETSSSAGMPATEVCMGCHSHLWAESPMLEPVRESIRTSQPIAWTRVHDLPDHVYFDHSIHIARGVGCVECHGRVDEMPLMWREKTLHMDWCVRCHRHPEHAIGPTEDVFQMIREERDSTQQREMMSEYDIDSAYKLSNCSICHR